MGRIIRILVVGDGFVGKTSIIKAYLSKHPYTEERFTIGLDVEAFRVENNDKIIVVIDIGGQKQFRAIAPLLINKVDVVFLVFDSTSPETLSNLKWWIGKIKSKLKGVPMLLIENKIDLKRAVTDDDVKKIMKKYKKIVGYMKVSAKKYTGIEEIFEKAIEIAATRQK